MSFVTPLQKQCDFLLPGLGMEQSRNIYWIKRMPRFWRLFIITTIIPYSPSYLYFLVDYMPVVSNMGFSAVRFNKSDICCKTQKDMLHLKGWN